MYFKKLFFITTAVFMGSAQAHSLICADSIGTHFTDSIADFYAASPTDFSSKLPYHVAHLKEDIDQLIKQKKFDELSHLKNILRQNQILMENYKTQKLSSLSYALLNKINGPALTKSMNVITFLGSITGGLLIEFQFLDLLFYKLIPTSKNLTITATMGAIAYLAHKIKNKYNNARENADNYLQKLAAIDNLINYLLQYIEVQEALALSKAL
jgi:hypothetical protein